MNCGDVLMKKWCFGTGRAKVKGREEAVMNNNGELQTYVTYPKYRTIVFKILSAEKKNDQWHVEGEQYSSLSAPPKKTNLVLNEKKGVLYVAGQKRPFLKMGDMTVKHAIVTSVGRNELTVYVKGQFKTVACRPGTIKWHSDKILASVA